MDDLKVKIGGRLKEYRLLRKLTQEQVAIALNIPQQQYARYENAKNIPSSENLIALCKLFEVSTDYILGLAEY